MIASGWGLRVGTHVSGKSPGYGGLPQPERRISAYVESSRKHQLLNQEMRQEVRQAREGAKTGCARERSGHLNLHPWGGFLPGGVEGVTGSTAGTWSSLPGGAEHTSEAPQPGQPAGVSNPVLTGHWLPAVLG